MKLFALLLPLFCLFSVPAFAEPSLAEFTSLVSRGHSEGRGTCSRFRKKWIAMVQGGLTRESPSHVSQQQSLDALKLFEKYPGRPRDAAKAWGYLVENEESLAKISDQKSVLEQVSRIEQACEQFSYFTHMTLLMKDLSVFPLPKKEKKRILAVVRKHLKDEDTDGQLSPLGMKINTLKDFVDSVYDGDNKIALKPKAAALLAELESSRAALKPEMLALSTAGKGETLEYWAPEFQLWKRLHESYRALLAEVQF
jgi:hypothetical protein